MNKQEIGALKESLKAAKEARMLWEFKRHYKIYRQQGETVQKTCYLALYDWDI